jgi:hypothetical protein
VEQAIKGNHDKRSGRGEAILSSSLIWNEEPEEIPQNPKTANNLHK